MVTSPLSLTLPIGLVGVLQEPFGGGWSRRVPEAMGAPFSTASPDLRTLQRLTQPTCNSRAAAVHQGRRAVPAHTDLCCNSCAVSAACTHSSTRAEGHSSAHTPLHTHTHAQLTVHTHTDTHMHTLHTPPHTHELTHPSTHTLTAHTHSSTHTRTAHTHTHAQLSSRTHPYTDLTHTPHTHACVPHSPRLSSARPGLKATGSGGPQ